MISTLRIRVAYIHVEIPDLADVFNVAVKLSSMTVGLAFQAATTSSPPQLAEVTEVLVMGTRDIGFCGRPLLASTPGRVNRLRGWPLADHRLPGRYLAVDGGVTARSIRELLRAGASKFVLSSTLFNADDMSRAVKDLRRAAAS
jgi:ribulose-phosphate 3-epimerase